MHMKLIGTVFRLKNGRALLQKRCAVPQTSFSSKYSIGSKKSKTNKTDDDDDDYDKPIKFSTSKAATFPAAYTTSNAANVPSYQGIVISLSLAIFLLYFALLREENDIDENMVKNIPPEIVEQIYGKPKNMKQK